MSNIVNQNISPRTNRELMLNAYQNATVIPAFNIPHLPMMAPVVKGLEDTNSFGFIAVAACEWERFEAKSQEAIFAEYCKCRREPWTRLHQDHVPVIDEDDRHIDYISILKKAVDLGFDSIMVDGSRLSLAENIAAAKEVVGLAKDKGIAVEAELGAVLGHEAGPLPPYEELFKSGQGFTSIDEAVTFVQQTNIDWLSVACGNIHGAIQGSAKDAKKVQARINIEHLSKLKAAVKIPLVLHGGSGIAVESIQAAIKNGIAKINIGTDIRQVYEQAVNSGKTIAKAQDTVYQEVCRILKKTLNVQNSRDVINPD